MYLYFLLLFIFNYFDFNIDKDIINFNILIIF
jgi:hypothetical protein